MMPTQRLMKRLLTDRLGLMRLSLFLTVLLLSACAGLRTFPATTLWEFDNKHQVCGEYKITDQEHFKFKHVRDVPLKSCPAIFGFTSTDTPKILNWLDESVAYGKQHCN